MADPTIYVSVPDDPAVRPDGHEAWFVLVNAPRHGTGPGAVDWDSSALRGSYAGRLLGLLAGRGLPVADRLLFSHVITPADLARATRAPGGAIYGSSSNGARVGVPAPAEPLAGARAVPGRRLDPPRRRPPPGRPLRPHRRPPRRPRLTRPTAAGRGR